MSDLSATVRAMAASGCTPEQIAAVVEKIEEERTSKSREGNRRRQAEWRQRRNENNTDNALLAVTQRDKDSPPPPPFPPHTPPISPIPTDSEAIASGAKAPNPDADLFLRGKEILGSSGGGQIAKIKALFGGDVAKARAFFEDAADRENPRQYVAATIKRNSAGNSYHQRAGPNGHDPFMKPNGQRDIVAEGLFDTWSKRNDVDSDSEEAKHI